MNAAPNIVWFRRQKGGRRRVTAVPVSVIGVTAAGNVLVEYTRRAQAIRRVVSRRNLAQVVAG